ncbi:asparagine synthase (glutamine-hydrolyzing) [Vibrio tubiashii]|uniref:asparagine synthase (glutamine-hydrolyzing) n=3 Tax=Vibrio tubiashii TaxID=29498 RepID=UPI001EFC7395|nr:asparagine synthase (glutamine-hydrolyzing) [Vibrio tubiashii]MCG9617719.1 asparagine synthase (glutamine-hydrolyzing) [Vibrio tubiashii]
MCGIFGVISSEQLGVQDALEVANKVQSHRGPDMASSVVRRVGNWNVGMSHQRLSILDLSDSGRQPMESASQASIIAFNGEVYNYKELGNALPKGVHLRSGSDTEVLLELCESQGVRDTLPQLNGMWAFCFLDTKNRKLILSRDRVGIKPLYYKFENGNFFFASEVKTILSVSNEKHHLNAEQIANYINQSVQDSDDKSFFEGIECIPAGTSVEIDLEHQKIVVKPQSYWDPIQSANTGTNDTLKDDLLSLFQDSVRLRMRSDVPVGVTLSGGLDSSAIAAMMKSFLEPNQKLLVLSAVSPGSVHDESKFIDIMAEYLNVEVNKVELKWSSQEAIDLLKEVSWFNDSPLGSFSNVAHYLLMKKAREFGIKVILSGQGADELLCGYKKYLAFYIQSLLRNGHYFKAMKVLFSFIKNGSMLGQYNFLEAKRYLPKILDKSKLDVRGSALKNIETLNLGLKKGQTLEERQLEDVKRFSVPYLTHYEDRMSMAFGREIRLPFLDFRLIELLLNAPSSSKINKGWTKYILRDALKDLLPKDIVWRKDKQGFVNPQEEWLRNELKADVLKIFDKNALVFKLDLICRDSFLSMYEDYCNQKTGKGRVWYREIFQPLALEIWLQEYAKFIYIPEGNSD